MEMCGVDRAIPDDNLPLKDVDEQLQYDPEQQEYGTFGPMQMFASNMHEHALLDMKRSRLLLYIFFILIYIGLNVALLAANFQDQDVIEENYYVPFHMSSFWGLFGFTALEALILMATDVLSWENSVQSALVLFDVMFTFATAMFFSLDPELYEVPAHFMEYSIQVMITGVNLIFLNTYIQAADSMSMIYRLRHAEKVVLLVVLALSFFQLNLYAGFPAVKMGPERSAHFCEFVNEIFNGSFALLYATFSYTDVKRKLEKHYIAIHRPKTQRLLVDDTPKP